RGKYAAWARLSEGFSRFPGRIQGIEQRFLLLPADTNVSLTLFITETDTVIGMGIEGDAIRLLARINASIEISLVVTQRDRLS
ncbi:MAG TPA: hypothetical protein PKE36_00675, partial [Chiayiivirga sp.]|nr:hypothetical protein [Chiayiivirga sp.]